MRDQRRHWIARERFFYIPTYRCVYDFTINRKYITELPAPVNPAKKRLAEVLSAYEEASGVAEELQAKLSRAESDEAKAAGDSALTEEEAIAKVAEAQSRKSVFASRAAGKRKVADGLLKDLDGAVRQAHAELRVAVTGEQKTRSQILADRICAVLYVIADPNPRQHFGHWTELVNYSKPVRAVRVLEMGNITGNDVVGMARTLLGNFERLEIEKGKSL